MNSFYSRDELINLGLKAFGEDVRISRKSSIYCAEKISIGNHVRIDDFCILSGSIELGNHIHIAAQAGLFAGRSCIRLADFTSVSSRVMIYAENDDYSGASLANPMVPDEYRNTSCGEVHLKKHSIIGSGSTVLPNISIGEGTAVGAMSLVTEDLEPWSIYAGIPAKKIKDRSKALLKYEKLINADNSK